MFGFGRKKTIDEIADIAEDPIGSLYDGAKDVLNAAIEHPGAAILGGVIAASLFEDEGDDEE